MSDLDLDAVRARFAKVEAIAAEESPSEYRLVAVHAHSAMDVPKLLAEIDRLRTELAEERQSHEQTVENFGDWIEQYNERSFKLTPPTQTTGWVWKCLLCPANGSFAREPDAFGFAVAHEHRTHGPARAEQ